MRRANHLPYLLGLCLILVTGYYFLFSSDSFSPEQLNSILQNKHQDILSINKHELSNQRIQKPYFPSNSLRMTNWETNGRTFINNNKYIRLTTDTQHQVGSIFNKHPITAESFELELTFHISSKSSLVGDGLAIWLLDSPSKIGDVFGATNLFNGLGIFIDTYKNGKRGSFPFVNVMLGDGHTKYIKATDGYESRLAGCSAKDVLNGETKMRLIYIKNGYLSIDFNWNQVHEDWKNCVSLTNIHLPKSLFMGLSAETGDLHHNVDIIENIVFELFKNDNTHVESLVELQNLLINDNDKNEKNNVNKKNSNDSKSKQARKKSAARLKNAEKRIKQRERDERLRKYGDPDARLLKRIKAKLLTFFKYLLAFTSLGLVSWFAWIVYRIQKQKKRQKSSGLLD